MFDDLKTETDVSDVTDVTDVLRSVEELEECVNETALRRRTMPRHKVCVRIAISPANSSQRDTFSIDAVTGDVSSGGCLAFADKAVLPGDVFVVDFSPGVADELGLVFSRCVRCRFISENRFELGFRFLQLADVNYVLDDLLDD